MNFSIILIKIKNMCIFSQIVLELTDVYLQAMMYIYAINFHVFASACPYFYLFMTELNKF